MTLPLNDALLSAAPGSDASTLGLNTEAQTKPEGPSFGQFMSGMQWPAAATGQSLEAGPDAPSLADGQALADPLALAAETMAAAPAWPLKEISVGPNLNAITPETAAPDMQSLKAFARAQGLDEKAVSWLFGKPEAGAAATGTTSASAAPVVATVPTHPLLANTLTNTLTNTLANPMTQPQAIMALTADKSAASLSTAGPAQAGGLATAALTLLAMAEAGSADKKAGPAQAPAPGSADDDLPINLLRMPPPAAVWMQRNVMNAVLKDQDPTPKGIPISESELDLGADWDPDTLSSLLGKDRGHSAATGSSATGTHSSAYANFAARWDAQAPGRADTGLASNAAPAEPSSAAARSENIQNLADKMGQAVGQRILSEMEKGQWHLKLQLRPATLGHIEVEMRMRGGEFDAIFTAPNATTRDLLQDGMAKLKETLAQMGMDVASIHVGNGQTGQSGGDPTPGSAKRAPLSDDTSAAEGTSDTQTRAPLVKTPKEGLDVLV